MKVVKEINGTGAPYNEMVGIEADDEGDVVMEFADGTKILFDYNEAQDIGVQLIQMSGHAFDMMTDGEI